MRDIGGTMEAVAREVWRRGAPTAARIPLATTRRVEIGRWQAMRNTRFFLDDDIHPAELKPEVDPDVALPADAVTDVVEVSVRPHPKLQAGTGHALLRAVPALDAVLAQPRVVLLGEPGAGKTCLLAGLTDPGPSGSGGAAVSSVLTATELADRVAARRPWPAPERGMAVDGLDEIPDVAARTRLLRTLAALPAGGPRVVLACRTAAYVDLAGILGWPTVTLAPLTIGQVLHLVRRLTDDLAAGGMDRDRLARAAAAVMDGCRPTRRHRRDGRPAGRIRELLRSPLLVTAAVLRATTRPERLRDAASWSEDVLDLLLGDWDAVRGRPPLEAGPTSAGAARRRLDELGYIATAAAPRPGRGVLPRPAADGAEATVSSGDRSLVERCGVLTRAAGSPGEWCHPCGRDTGARHVDVLLAADVTFSDAVLAPAEPFPAPAGPVGFATLTLQEHCAAGHLLTVDVPPDSDRWSDGIVARLLAHRGRDRWSEPLFLAAERLDAVTRAALVAALLDANEAGRPKPPDRAQRDAVTAARIVVRIALPDGAADEPPTTVPAAEPAEIAMLRPQVQDGLVRLLADPQQPLLERNRIAAGDLLGALGDPRYPVTAEHWSQQVRLAFAGDRSGYLRPVPAAGGLVLVGRYPVTWEQWRQQPGAVERVRSGRCPTSPNEPATALWHEVIAWCTWLSGEAGVTVRLPHEQEWEAAAGCTDGRVYPWGDPQTPPLSEPAYDRAWTFASKNRYGIFDRTTVPVGCYPAGAGPNGLLDLAGNVGEWTLEPVDGAPGRYVQRGAGSSNLDVRCSARFLYGTTGGFRVVVEP